VIDLHAHIVLEESLGRAGASGPELIEEPPSFRVGEYVLHGVRYRGTPFMDLPTRLEAMSRLGIAHQVLSPNPLTSFVSIDAADALAYARVHNDALAQLSSGYPQLSGLAQLPMQSPAAAVAELGRAVDIGLVGAAIVPDGFLPLDDPALDVLWECFVALDTPCFIHPNVPGIDERVDSRRWRFGLELTVGFAEAETRAVTTLICGGVVDRHPGLRIWVSHGGGALVALAPKLRRAAERRPGTVTALAEPGAFDDRLRRLWFDGHGAPDGLRGLTGDDRICGGTNFAGWDQPDSLPAPDLVTERDAASIALLGFDPR